MQRVLTKLSEYTCLRHESRMAQHFADFVVMRRLLFATLEPCGKDIALRQEFMTLRQHIFASFQVSILVDPCVERLGLALIQSSGNKVSLVLLKIGFLRILADHNDHNPAVNAFIYSLLELKTDLRDLSPAMTEIKDRFKDLAIDFLVVILLDLIDKLLSLFHLFDGVSPRQKDSLDAPCCQELSSSDQHIVPRIFEELPVLESQECSLLQVEQVGLLADLDHVALHA